VVGVQNLPAQSITGTTETALLVPAAGLYPSFPSPTYAAGTGLWLGTPPDIQGSDFDGHAFKVRVAGKVFTGAAATLVTKLYQVPAAIVAAGTSATVANDVVVVTNAASASVTGAANFVVEAQFIWDSASLKLGTSAGINQVAGAAVTPTLVSPTLVYAAPATINVLNFIPSFTFSAGNAANTVTVTEFFIERV
jgi:hypothetical protein